MIERRRRTSAPPAPAGVTLKTLKYGEAQEHFLRRLAGALVLQWDALPDALQDLIIAQAAVVDDRETAPHETADIENFIRGVKVVALAKAPGADAE
jgi:hypothetical protein